MSAATDERLRQEREAFDVNKGQSIGRFCVEMATATVLLLILVGVAGLCGAVILNPERFGKIAAGVAVTGLIAELAGVITVFVRFVLSPANRTVLQPVSRTHRD